MTFKAYPPLKRDAQSWAGEANVTTCPQTPAIWLLTSSKPQVPEILYNYILLRGHVPPVLVDDGAGGDGECPGIRSNVGVS